MKSVLSSEAFGAWLKRRRKTLGLTQADLAQRVGCSPDTLYRIEAGRRRPSKQIASRLAAALGIAPEEQRTFLHMARAGLPSHEGGNADLSDAPTALASPRTLDLHVCLPAPPSALVGREQEVSEVQTQLLRADVRLVTLTGQGGVGKTWLSLEIAAGLTPAFRDGVYFVPLAPITDSELVGRAIARVLSIPELPGVTIQQRLLDFLHNRQLLLVLDNFEQVVRAAPLVVELLSVCLDLKILVTSREPLGLWSEWLFDLEGLRFPSEDCVIDLEAYSAMRLFIQRARQGGSVAAAWAFRTRGCQ